MVSILNCQNEVLASYTGVVLHPPCKTTFPSPGRIHGNSGRVCKKVGSKLFAIHLHLSDAVLYGKRHCSIFRMFTAKFFFLMSEFLGFRRYFSNFYSTNISSLRDFLRETADEIVQKVYHLEKIVRKEKSDHNPESPLTKPPVWRSDLSEFVQ